MEQSGEEERSIEKKTIKEEEPATNQDQVEKVVKVNQAQNLIKKIFFEASSARAFSLITGTVLGSCKTAIELTISIKTKKVSDHGPDQTMVWSELI